MSRFLQVVWICKVLLTTGTAWRYCSETVWSPFCGISVFYSLALFASIFITCQKRNGFAVLEDQEGIHLKMLEEGVQERFVSVNQNGSLYSSIRSGQRKWEDTFKEKHT